MTKPNAAPAEGFRAIDEVVSEIERDPTRKGELDKAREHLRQFVSHEPATSDVASMVEQLRQWGPALKIGAAVPRAQVGDLMVQAADLLLRLGQGYTKGLTDAAELYEGHDRYHARRLVKELLPPAPGASE